MSTITVEGSTGRLERREAKTRTRAGVGKVGLGAIAVLTILVSAWGGIVPYVGPLFGYTIDGGGAWHWSLAHSLLSLAPGALGVVLGFMILAETRGLEIGRGRFSLASAGVLIALCGAWFVVGPTAWPLVVNHGSDAIVGTQFHRLEVALATASGLGPCWPSSAGSPLAGRPDTRSTPYRSNLASRVTRRRGVTRVEPDDLSGAGHPAERQECVTTRSDQPPSEGSTLV